MRTKWIGLLIAICCLFVISATHSGKRVVDVVMDFSTGMHPSYAKGTAQTFAYIENMMSLQPGGMQIRTGYTGFLPDPSSPALDTTTSVALFSPTRDSAYMVYTSGGTWYGNQAGVLKNRSSVIGTAPELEWKATLGAMSPINARNFGDSIKLWNASIQLTGFGTRFIRDIMPGDSIVFSDTTTKRVVTVVVNDQLLYVSPSYTGSTSKKHTTWTVRRKYDKAGGPPFLVQAGDFMYTGNISIAPQVIYNEDETLYLRELGIVDSFYIDSVYYWSGRYKAMDTTGTRTEHTWSDPRYLYTGDAGGKRCSMMYMLDPYATWDTSVTHAPPDTFNTFLKSFQVVSRTKTWFENQWREKSTLAPETYFVRLGPKTTDDRSNTKYFTISANDDTSLYLNAWYLSDTALNFTQGTGRSTHWNDSLLKGRGTELSDTIPKSDLVGTWGYIYSSAGTPEPIVDDTSTNTLNILCGGAVSYTVDANFPKDTIDFVNGMYFLVLTGGDVRFEGTKTEVTTYYGVWTWISNPPNAHVPPSVPTTDTLTHTEVLYAVWSYDILTGQRLKRISGYYWRKSDAENWVKQNKPSFYKIEESIKYFYKKLFYKSTNKNTSEYIVGNTMFPIRYVQVNGDTTFFISSISEYIESATTASTKYWEIVRARLPHFREMLKSPSGGKLYGWGDTLALATISSSEYANPWEFSGSNDIIVGDRFDPITAVCLYDDQVIAFKMNSITSVTNGNSLSDGIGCVGRRALYVHDKWVFFVSEDGVYRLERRDLAGYSIVPISRDMDPILQSWSSTLYGTNVVPIRVYRNFLENVNLTYNFRDHHLWMWVPTTSGGGLGAALTYNTETNVWDGVQRIPVGCVANAFVRDTSRIIFGSVDSSYVFALDYEYDDNGRGIASIVQSKPFVTRDESNRKLQAKLASLTVTSSALDGTVDSAYVLVTRRAGAPFGGSAMTKRFNLTISNVTLQTNTQTFYPDKELVGQDWEWSLYVWGAAAGSNFAPVELEFEWVPVRDN